MRGYGAEGALISVVRKGCTRQATEIPSKYMITHTTSFGAPRASPQLRRDGATRAREIEETREPLQCERRNPRGRATGNPPSSHFR